MQRVDFRRRQYLEQQIDALSRRAESSAFHERVLEEVVHGIDVVTSVPEAFKPERVLGHRAKQDLTGVLRYKGYVGKPWDHGLRIFYVACPSTHRGVLLEYGDRHQGRPDDAYSVFAERLRRGYYDGAFRVLGQQHAYWKVPPPPAPAR